MAWYDVGILLKDNHGIILQYFGIIIDIIMIYKYKKFKKRDMSSREKGISEICWIYDMDYITNMVN